MPRKSDDGGEENALTCDLSGMVKIQSFLCIPKGDYIFFIKKGDYIM